MWRISPGVVGQASMIGAVLVILIGMGMGAFVGLVVAAFMFNLESDAVRSGFMVAGAVIEGINETGKFFPRGGKRRR